VSEHLAASCLNRMLIIVCSDAIIPAQFMPGINNADLGSHCFEYVRPSFRGKASNGSRVMYVQIVSIETYSC